MLAAERGSSKEVRDFGSMLARALLPAIQNAELETLVVQVAPAFEAHMMAAQNLDKKLAGR
jgi:hypothetical protein